MTWGFWKEQVELSVGVGHWETNTQGTEVLELHLCLVQSLWFPQGDLSCGLCCCTEKEPK